MEQKRHDWRALAFVVLLPLMLFIGAYFAAYLSIVEAVHVVRSDPSSGGRVLEEQAIYSQRWPSQSKWFFAPAHRVDRYFRPRKWFVKRINK